MPGILLFLIAAPIALLVLRFLARVDSFWMYGAGMSLSALGALILGAIGLGSAQTNYVALLGAAVCGGVFAACVRQRSRIRRGLVADRVPNKLVERFGPEAVQEFEGVQVVATGSQVVRPGEVAEICFYLQNCHDAAGDFVVKARLPIELEAGQKARVPAEARVRLGPLAVGVMKLPILTTATLGPGTYLVELEFGVDGFIGRRVRKWRAERTIENPSTPIEVAFLAVATVTDPVSALIHLSLEDGVVRYSLRVEGTPVRDERDLPPVGYEILWQPRDSVALPNGSEEAEAVVEEASFERFVAPEPMPAFRNPETESSRSKPCVGCAVEVDAKEAERSGSCPNCGAFWY